MFALQFFGGLFGLLLGADMAVGGCMRLARRWNLPPWVTGMLLLALGTSLPEFFVGLSASAEHPGLALGTVFGSNAVNVGGVFALMLIFAKKGIPLRAAGLSTLLALVTGSGLAFWAFSAPTPSVIASSALLGLFAFVIWATLRDGRRRKNADPVSSLKESFPTSLLLAMGGFALLAFSSTFFINGALGFAELFGWREGFVGYVIVALGTSAPEMFTSIGAIRRGHPGVVFGNILGSNTFNLLMVGGTVGLMAGAPIDVVSVQPQLWVNLVASLVLLIPLLRGRDESRGRTKTALWMGILLFLAYLAAARWIGSL